MRIVRTPAAQLKWFTQAIARMIYLSNSCRVVAQSSIHLGGHSSAMSKILVGSHYDAVYGDFTAELSRDIRRDAFGEDIGQNSWLTAREQDMFIPWLNLGPGKRLLDVGCGAGGPALRMASKTSCSVTGIDMHRSAIRTANALAAEMGLDQQAEFRIGDAMRRLSYSEGTFDAITCIDAINHLPDRQPLITDWCRILKPGGRLLFTNPVVITGPLTNNEIAQRTSAGFYMLTPEGYDEQILARCGMRLLQSENVTRTMAESAEKRLAARASHEAALRKVEGDGGFEALQKFLYTVALVARESRLSRFMFLAEK
jgi:2-polyprenyl-3-methyl-5-hydroxy-6-metoxy-1,4-benzoquinol methylase